MQDILLQITNLSKNVQEKIAKLEIFSYWDALLHIPIRYDDLTAIYPIAEVKHGTTVLIEGEVINCNVINKKQRQLRVELYDGSASITLIFFHFYPNYQTQYQVGKKIRAFGEVKVDFLGNPTIIHPKIKTVNNDNEQLMKTFSPIYRVVAGIEQYNLIKIIDTALNYNIPETIPNAILYKYDLVTLSEAFRILHKLKPEEFENKLHLKALTRLKVDELVAQQLIMLKAYQQKHSNDSYPLKSNNTLVDKLLNLLPFRLTKAQIRVQQEIFNDLAKSTQMNRLLQGDVGSGKTIIALLAMLVAVENGFQACIIAPTEILAEQHYLKIKALLDQMSVKSVWLTGSLNKKSAVYKEIQLGEAKIIIGTHAVFQKDVQFKNLAIIVIDEQHRFGVDQRLLLQNKGQNPHQLMMSATPIPRTLAMSYFADLDVSNIDELPPGRTPIKTLLINNNRRDEVIGFIKVECSKQRQIYWVCPLIEESEKLDLENAINTYNELTELLTPISVGLVHGRLSYQEKAQVMEQFSQGLIQVLVATTVIEVGVDVPNASIMVIEHSERMGLSSLHQLRGRVGRGSLESQCILLYQNTLSDLAKRRLKVIFENTDGFKIAQEDLLIRGPGELLGSRQSGLPNLKFANLEYDLELLKVAKVIAKNMAENYPDLSIEHTKLWFSGYEHFLNV